MSIITATATQETLYLCSVPGMKKSIIEASKEPLEDSVEDIGWLRKIHRRPDRLFKDKQILGERQIKYEYD